MTIEEFAKIKEGQLITIHSFKDHRVKDIFHYSAFMELRHHHYRDEDYYYLSMSGYPKLEDISFTTKEDIIEFYNSTKVRFDAELDRISNLVLEL